MPTLLPGVKGGLQGHDLAREALLALALLAHLCRQARDAVRLIL